MQSAIPEHARNPETIWRGPIQVFEGQAVITEAAARPRPENRPREEVAAPEQGAYLMQTFTGSAQAPITPEPRPRPVGRDRPTAEQLASEFPDVPTDREVDSEGT